MVMVIHNYLISIKYTYLFCYYIYMYAFLYFKILNKHFVDTITYINIEILFLYLNQMVRKNQKSNKNTKNKRKARIIRAKQEYSL